MVSISDSAITDLGHDDPDESEGSEEATDHASRSTNTELPVAMNLSHARAAENHDVNGDLGLTMLVDLPNVPPFLSDDEAVEETSDDDYQPIIDEPSDLVPHPHFRATAYVGQEGGENGENHETDDEERESTEDKPDARERLEQQHVAQLLAGVDDTGSVEEEKLDNLRHDQFVPVDSGPAPGDLPNQSSRELDDHDLSKILVQLREQDDQEDALRRNGDTRDQGHPIESAGWSDQDLIHAQSQSPTENDIERDSPVFAVKYERSDARKSQAEKDLLISEFLSANVMELSTNFDKDIEKLDFDDIAASKARLAAHRRNGFINARKFLFETSFDPILIPAGAESADVGSIDVQLEGAALPPEPEPPPPPPPSFSAEELAAARAVAWSEGEAAGREAARQEIAQTLNHNLQNLAENITQLLAEREQQISHFGSEAGKIAAAMVGKLFPELARRGGATEIEALLHSSIELARERPRLTVSLAPHLQSLLEEKLRDLAKAQGFEGHLTFIADGAMGDSDVRMEWSDGGIERLAARTWQNISDLLVRLDQAHAHG